jgi:hypothetical protein
VTAFDEAPATDTVTAPDEAPATETVTTEAAATDA